MHTTEDLSLNVLARLEGVFYCEEEEASLEAAREPVLEAVGEALDRLEAMRAAEGKALAEEIRHRIGLLCEGIIAVEDRIPELTRHYEQRLRTRLAELKAEVGLAEERLAMEVAFLAEKTDITEELVRLKAHVARILELLSSDKPVGRELDFLTQEVHRELNTLGVKARNTDVLKEVLTMKAELEKVREQVQNVE